MDNVKLIATVAITFSASFGFLSYDTNTNNPYYAPVSNSSNYTEDNLTEKSLGNLNSTYSETLTNTSYQNGIDSITSTYTPLEVRKVTSEKNENINILNSFKKLENNWDGYDALAPTKEIINTVCLLINELDIQPEIFPTPDGGIQLEYVIGENRHLNIEILPNNTMNVFEMFSDRTYSESNNKLDFNIIKLRVDKFYDSI